MQLSRIIVRSLSGIWKQSEYHNALQAVTLLLHRLHDDGEQQNSGLIFIKPLFEKNI
jgi:hypothetical protein